MAEFDSRRSGLTKDETRTALRAFNWNVALRMVFDSVCTGTGMFFTAFALALGLKKESMGLIGSLVSAACLLQLVGVALNSHIHNKKKLTVILAVIEPLIMISAVILLAVFTPRPAIARPLIAVAVFTVAAFLHMTKPTTDEWLASTIPAGLRGRYLGRRFQILSVIGIATGLAMAVAGDYLKRELGLTGLAMVLVVGGLFGVAAVWPLTKARMPVASAQSKVSWADVRHVLRDKRFTRLLAALIIYNLPFCVATAFYFAFYIDVLGMSLKQAALLPIGYQAIKIPSLWFFSRHANRANPKLVLLGLGVIYAMFFACKALATPEHLWPVYLAWAFVALGDGGYNVYFFSLVYDVVPNRSGRQAYFAGMNLLILGAFAIGGLIGREVLTQMEGVSVTIGSHTFGQFQTYWLGVAVAMLLANAGLVLIQPKSEERGPGVG